MPGMDGPVYLAELSEPCPGCGKDIWVKTIQGPGVTRIDVPLECVPGGSPSGRPDVAADPSPAAGDGRFLVAGDEAAFPELRWEQHWCPQPGPDHARQRDGWRRALTAQARAVRRRRRSR